MGIFIAVVGSLVDEELLFASFLETLGLRSFAL